MSNAVHISLKVSDLEKSVDFYRRLFGEPQKLKPEYAKFVGEQPEIHLALQPTLLPHRSGEGALSHLGIRVESTEEVRRRRDGLRERGLLSEEEVRADCCYALQDKFWLSDPDGNRWEIYTVIRDSEGESASATPCCAASGR